MNKERRKSLDLINANIGLLLDTMLSDFHSDLEDICGAEQEAFDGMPESFQQGDRGDKAQTAIDALQEAIDYVQEAIDAMQNAQSAIENAKGE